MLRIDSAYQKDEKPALPWCTPNPKQGLVLSKPGSVLIQYERTALLKPNPTAVAGSRQECAHSCPNVAAPRNFGLQNSHAHIRGKILR